MRVLLDTNVVLDFFLEREPFFQEANEVFEAIASKRLEGFITASSATDIFYVCKRQTQSIVEAKRIIISAIAVLSICPVDRINIETALSSGLLDFEDAVQLACAIQQQLDAIVTRNAKDFQDSVLPVLTVKQMLMQLK